MLEHISGNGDTMAIKELSRVLRKNGILSLTVPFDLDGFEEHRHPNSFYYSNDKNQSKVFYQRRYNETDLYDRLIIPSKLKLVSKVYCGQKFKPFNHDLHKFITPLFGPTLIFLNRLLVVLLVI